VLGEEGGRDSQPRAQRPPTAARSAARAGRLNHRSTMRPTSRAASGRRRRALARPIG